MGGVGEGCLNINGKLMLMYRQAEEGNAARLYFLPPDLLLWAIFAGFDLEMPDAEQFQ